MHKLLSDNRIFMNTTVEITAWTDLPREKIYKIFDRAYQQFHFVIEKFSRFDVNSELSKLNNSAGKKFKSSKELFQLIEYSLKLAKKTDGIFDPTIIDFLETYGYKAGYDFSKLKNPKKLQKEISAILKNRPSFRDIKLEKKNFTIKLARNQRIDLGSIGKGYAIDKAYKKLLPLKNFIINAGGDIRAHGNDKTGNPWLINLKIPGQRSIGKIQLKNKSICCSGSSARKVKFFHHLINPKTGKPQNEIKAVFVTASSAMEADAWATALYAAGTKAKSLARKHNIQCQIVAKPHNK